MDATSASDMPGGTERRRPEQARTFVYAHTVSFEETNVVGNVYFVRHIAWQGRCREMFLRRHAPSTLALLKGDLRLVTLRVSCEYHGEIFAFDEIEIAMRLVGRALNKIELAFGYWRIGGTGRELVAEGAQTIGCMRLLDGSLERADVPDELDGALKVYAERTGDRAGAHGGRGDLA